MKVNTQVSIQKIKSIRNWMLLTRIKKIKFSFMRFLPSQGFIKSQIDRLRLQEIECPEPAYSTSVYNPYWLYYSL